MSVLAIELYTRIIFTVMCNLCGVNTQQEPRMCVTQFGAYALMSE